jgi:putative transposase
MSFSAHCLAPVLMLEDSQSKRTFFVTSNTDGKRPLLQSHRMAGLLLDVFQTNRKLGRLLLHEFVIMPDHFHLLLTPTPHNSLERALQFIKGGFSYRVMGKSGRGRAG